MIEDDADDSRSASPELKPAPEAPFLWATYLLLAINLAVMGLAYNAGGQIFSPSTGLLVKWGANYGPRTMDGEYWRLLTALFVHFGQVWFAALNLYVLFSLGRDIEQTMGSVRFIGIYLLAGIGGNLGVIIWNPRGFSYGGVGAIMGLVGSLIAYFICNRQWFSGAEIRSHLKGLVYCILLNLGLNASMSGNVSGIIGGLITGMLAGFVFVPVIPGEHFGRARQSLGALLLALVLFAGGYYGYARTIEPTTASTPSAEILEDLEVDKANIQYSHDFNKETVERLGKELSSMGYTQSRSTIFLRKENGRIALGVVLKDGAWNTPEVIASYKKMGQQLSDTLFDSQTIDIQFYDKHSKLQKTIEVKPAKILF